MDSDTTMTGVETDAEGGPELEVVEGGEADGQDTDTTTQPEDGPKDDGPDPRDAILAKYEREHTRLIKTIQRLQEKVAKPSEKPNGYNQTASTTLQEDEDGNVVYHGASVPKAFAEAQIARDEQLSSLMEAVTGIQHARESQEEEQAMDALGQTVLTTISEIRGDMFPDIAKEHAGRIDKHIFRSAHDFITEARENGEEFSPALINRAIKSAVDESKELFGIFGAKQATLNQTVRDKDKAKAGGSPGVKSPKAAWQMTEAERSAAFESAAKKVMATYDS